MSKKKNDGKFLFCERSRGFGTWGEFFVGKKVLDYLLTKVQNSKNI